MAIVKSIKPWHHTQYGYEKITEVHFFHSTHRLLVLVPFKVLPSSYSHIFSKPFHLINIFIKLWKRCPFLSSILSIRKNCMGSGLGSEEAGVGQLSDFYNKTDEKGYASRIIIVNKL